MEVELTRYEQGLDPGAPGFAAPSSVMTTEEDGDWVRYDEAMKGIESLELLATSLDSEIDELNCSNDSLEGQIMDLEGEVSEIEFSLSDAYVEIEDLRNELSKSEAEVSFLEQEVSAGGDRA